MLSFIFLSLVIQQPRARLILHPFKFILFLDKYSTCLSENGEKEPNQKLKPFFIKSTLNFNIQREMRIMKILNTRLEIHSVFNVTTTTTNLPQNPSAYAHLDAHTYQIKSNWKCSLEGSCTLFIRDYVCSNTIRATRTWINVFCWPLENLLKFSKIFLRSTKFVLNRGIAI